MAITERYVSSSGTDTYANSTNPATPMSLTTAFANAAAGDRINIKADGTYTRTAVDIFSLSGSSTSPIVFRGYLTTPGDGYQGRVALGGVLVTTHMPLIDYASTYRFVTSGAWVILETLIISGSVDNNVCGLSGTSCAIRSCVITNASTGGGAVGINGGAVSGVVIFHCDVTLSGASGGSSGISDTGTARIVGNLVKTTSTAAAGINAASVGTILANTVHSAGRGVFLSSTNSRCTVAFNTITACAGDGVDVITGNGNLQCIVGNLITDNGGYGIDLNNAAVAAFLAYNRTRDNTSGAINLGTDWVSATNFGAVTTDTGGPETDYVDAATKDFRLIAASPAVNAFTPTNASIGSLQRDQSGSGGAAAETSHAYIG